MTQPTTADAAQQGKKRKRHTPHEENGRTIPPSVMKAEKHNKYDANRALLPIAAHASAIREALRSRDVLLLRGETGSGKSTQVPQFLLDEPWCKGKCIAITQPRRVAAVSLARRVAQEMGTTLGSSSPASKVGYSVRFDHNVAPATRIKYLTEGMLLQEMLRDQSLSQYAAVVVDEVHERSVNVDLILGFVRRLVTQGHETRNGRPLKAVVMSATANIEALNDFFYQGYHPEQGQPKPQDEEKMPVQGDAEHSSDDSWSGLADRDSGPQNVVKSNGDAKATMEPNATNHDRISTCYIKGRPYHVKDVYLDEATQDFTEAALQKVFHIHYKEPLPGDVLVFLPGQDSIEALEGMINEYASAMDPKMPKVRIKRRLRYGSHLFVSLLTKYRYSPCLSSPRSPAMPRISSSTLRLVSPAR